MDTTAPAGDDVTCYATHTRLSDPGRFGQLLDDLPEEVPELCAAVRGLVVVPWCSHPAGPKDGSPSTCRHRWWLPRT
jgi:hypothetical protein